MDWLHDRASPESSLDDGEFSDIIDEELADFHDAASNAGASSFNGQSCLPRPMPVKSAFPGQA